MTNSEIKINQAIINLLKEKSFANITIGNICNTAQVGRSTFYNHFYDKYDVIEQMNEKWKKIIEQRMDQRFRLKDIQNFLNEFLADFNDPELITLLKIKDTHFNLIQDLKAIMKKSFLKNNVSRAAIKNLNISEEFASNFFVSIAFSLINESINNNNQEQITNAISYINKLQKELFNNR